MMLSISRTCLRGIYSCHWNSQNRRQNRACCWLSFLSFVSILALSWMYVCFIAFNDHSDVNWHAFKTLKKWVNWYMIVMVVSAVLATYCLLLLIFGLLHLAVREPLDLHWLHKQETCPHCVQVPEEQEIEICSREPRITKDLHTAVGWLRKNLCVLRGLVKDLRFLQLKEEDQKKALLQLSQAEMADDQQLAKEPFVFQFQFKDNMDIFLDECMDKRGLKINCLFLELIYFSFLLSVLIIIVKCVPALR